MDSDEADSTQSRLGRRWTVLDAVVVHAVPRVAAAREGQRVAKRRWPSVAHHLAAVLRARVDVAVDELPRGGGRGGERRALVELARPRWLVRVWRGRRKAKLYGEYRLMCEKVQDTAARVLQRNMKPNVDFTC